MKAYFFSLIASALCIAFISMLSPDGSIAKYIRLLTSLLFICLLLSPIRELSGILQSIAGGEISFPEMEIPSREEATEELDALLDSTSKAYFLQSLTQHLEREFAIDSGNVRCIATWEDSNGQTRPLRITVILSGSAIWKNPKELESYVCNLIGCECISAIE